LAAIAATVMMALIATTATTTLIAAALAAVAATVMMALIAATATTTLIAAALTAVTAAVMVSLVAATLVRSTSPESRQDRPLKILKQCPDLRYSAARQIPRQRQILRNRKSAVLMRGDDTVEERGTTAAILRMGRHSADQGQQCHNRDSPVVASVWPNHHSNPRTNCAVSNRANDSIILDAAKIQTEN